MPNIATVAPKKSSLASMQAAVVRLKEKADKAKESGTLIARELVSTGETAVTSFAAGFADERWGEADETGVKIHKTSDVPSSLLAGVGLKMAAGLGVFGEFQRDAFAAGTGALAHYASVQGRRAAIAFMQRSAASRETPAADKAKAENTATAAAV